MRKVLILAVVLCAGFASSAHAQEVAGVDQLLTQFQTATAAWGPALQNIALFTFGLLATIDLVWFVGVRTILQRGDIIDFTYALVNEILYLGFFLWLLTTFSTTGPLIIQGFQKAAQMAGGIPTQPNAVFAEGIKIATDVTGQISILHPGDSLTLMLCGIIVVGCFAWITAAMVVVIVESFFIVSAGQILLMFGGSRFTSDMTRALLHAVVGIGLKLYILQLIASVGAAFIANWIATVHVVTFQGIMIIIGQSFILATMTSFLPARFERLVSHYGSGGAGNVLAVSAAMGMAGSALAGGIGTAVTSALGVGVATSAASQLAKTQLAIASSNGSGPSTAAGRAASMISSTAGNLVSAKSQDVVRGLSGQRGNAGQSSWRMTASMNERNRLLKEGQNGP